MTGSSPYWCRHVDSAARLLEIGSPDFDYDNFAEVAEALLQHLGMTVLEQEANADLHVCWWILKVASYCSKGSTTAARCGWKGSAVMLGKHCYSLLGCSASGETLGKAVVCCIIPAFGCYWQCESWQWCFGFPLPQ